MKIKLILLCLFLTSTSLWAHPHVFIDAKVAIEKEKIIITWVFDEMSSSVILVDYDKNKNKILEQNEIDFIEKDHFRPLSDYSYFSAFVEGKKETKIKTYKTFRAFIEKGRLSYQFEVTKPKNKLYEIHFYDPEMYLALLINKKDVTCYSGAICTSKGYDADFYYGYKVMVKE